jgi:hypothetical protein
VLFSPTAFRTPRSPVPPQARGITPTRSSPGRLSTTRAMKALPAALALPALHKAGIPSPPILNSRRHRETETHSTTDLNTLMRPTDAWRSTARMAARARRAKAAIQPMSADGTTRAGPRATPPTGPSAMTQCLRFLCLTREGDTLCDRCLERRRKHLL